MRSTILTTLALAPALLHAQTPQILGGSLQARANAPYTLAAATTPAAPAAADATASRPAVRVSTGVIQPLLIDRPEISYSGRDLNLNPANNEVVVNLLVDAKGATSEVSIVKSINKTIDERVLAAVRQFKFRPATLDAQAIPVHMNLSIQLAR